MNQKKICYLLLLLVQLSLPAQACNPSHESVAIGSFKVKWLGYFDETRDNKGLAMTLRNCDIVVIQELISLPEIGRIGLPTNWRANDISVDVFPNGSPIRSDPGASVFFEAMKNVGFDSYVLSEEDTGPTPKQFSNSAHTEWPVAFYKSSTVCTVWDKGCGRMLRGGYIVNDRAANEIFSRVPYAFSFRAVEGAHRDFYIDFVLVSVHLQPNPSRTAQERRRKEFVAIVNWAQQQEANGEVDIIIAGDMNIHSCDELGSVLPSGYASLNWRCDSTSTSRIGRPFDHVVYDSENLIEGAEIFGFGITNLVPTVATRWPTVRKTSGPFPGEPYRSKIFPKYYSDHNPIHFNLRVDIDDDAFEGSSTSRPDNG